MSKKIEEAIMALGTVSFYARINHGDKARDYGKIVDKQLKELGLPTGELIDEETARAAIAKAEGR